MTQEQLATCAKMTQGNISGLETGKWRYTQESLEILAHCLHCSPADLLERDPNNEAGGILPLWNRAGPEKRQLLIDLAKTVLKDEH